MAPSYLRDGLAVCDSRQAASQLDGIISMALLLLLLAVQLSCTAFASSRAVAALPQEPAQSGAAYAAVGTAAETAWLDVLAPSDHVGTSRKLLQEQQQQLAARAADSNSKRTSNSSDAPGDEEDGWVQSLQQQALPAWARASNLIKPAADGQCPGCVAGSCFDTDQGPRCTSCLGSLFVFRSDGTCGCPGGRYNPPDMPATCRDCEKSHFCTGGKYTGTPGTPPHTSCGIFGEGLTTLGLRSTSKKQCVNLPGFLYVLDPVTNDPSAAPCPADTYGPGLRKQRACPACPDAYTTYGKTKQTSILSCVLAPGYWQVAPGRVVPCPLGTYKADTNPTTNCTKCAGVGVTTPTEASTSEKNCTDVMMGVYATSVVDGIVRATAKCPQKYYCPGGTARQSIDINNIPAGDPTIVRCPQGMWTQVIGANIPDLCLVPPGHFASATETQPCPNGQYRPGWVKASEGGACLKCSSDGSIQSMATDVITTFKLDGTEVALLVKATEKSCYIVGGQALVLDTATNLFKAVNCDRNNWGVTDITFGLNPNTVCKDCPENLVTNKNPITNPISSSYYKSDNSVPPRGGFTAKEACVTKPGWGNVKGVVEPCVQGFWSPGDTMDACTECGYGLTTGPNSTQSSENDCVVAPGFGWVRRSVEPCPIGSYNDEIRKANNTPCTPCPGGSTNTAEGSTSKDTCNLCKAGYGGAKCDVCGGENPNYGPGVRAIGTACKECPGIGGPDGGGGIGGYTFLDPAGGTNFYTPRVIAAIGATQPTDCIGEFTQIVDAAWNLEPQIERDWGGAPVSVETHADCIQLCTFDTGCQFVQFDYTKTENNCRLKVISSRDAIGSDFVAYKAVPSTDMGAASVQQAGAADGSVGAQAVVASGKYTIWRDPTASRIGRQQDPSQGNPLNYNTCLQACDDDGECAGVFMTLQAINLKPLACKLIYGDKTPGIFKRTMLKMVTDADHMDMYTVLGVTG